MSPVAHSRERLLKRWQRQHGTCRPARREARRAWKGSPRSAQSLALDVSARCRHTAPPRGARAKMKALTLDADRLKRHLDRAIAAARSTRAGRGDEPQGGPAQGTREEAAALAKAPQRRRPGRGPGRRCRDGDHPRERSADDRPAARPRRARLDPRDGDPSLGRTGPPAGQLGPFDGAPEAMATIPGATARLRARRQPTPVRGETSLEHAVKAVLGAVDRAGRALRVFTRLDRPPIELPAAAGHWVRP